MCGIVGYCKYTNNEEKNSDFLKYGLNLLKHRGPDDSGTYFSDTRDVGLGHTRLSILDLSELGHQPMYDLSDRYVLVYNGEIYNFKSIRKELEQYYEFKSNSDSEVVLYAYIHYGLDFLEKLNGIFSLAIYDKYTEELLIARDRFGVKPLYYTSTASGLYFASELKVLMTLDDLNTDLDYQGIDNYMTFLWSPSPLTPLKAVKKLEPAYYCIIKNGEIIKKKKFYQLSYQEEDRSLSWLIEETDKKLQEAVSRQVVSDVPIGAFLSGGLDSSAIVSYVKNFTDINIPTFTIKSENDLGMADDYKYAKQVAKQLGVEVHSIEISHELFFEIENMIYYLDEPQADLAPILVSYISKIAKEEFDIKVLLSGAGGDDIFSGYRRHYALQLDNTMKNIPSGIRKIMKKSIDKLPSQSSFLRRLKKYMRYFDLDGDSKIISYFYWITKEKRRQLFSNEVKAYLEDTEYCSSYKLHESINELEANVSDLNKMLYLEKNYFLTDHNLNYTDKMGMKEGVEIRVPLLDNNLVEFTSTISSKFKQHGKDGKYIFKKVMEKYISKDVIYRPKTGFGTPLKKWIHNELSEYINTILSKENMDKRGLFNYESFQKMLQEDKLNIEDHSYNILSILSIEIWCKIFIDNREEFKKIGV